MFMNTSFLCEPSKNDGFIPKKTVILYAFLIKQAYFLI